MRFEIREVEDLEGLLAIEEIQRQAWGFADKEIVPESVLVAIQRAGGLILGAVLPGGEMGGFVFSLAALRDGGSFHHSHMAAVLPDLRGSGIALALKREQREKVLALGLDRIEWTFDPMEARNGCFNFRKLGVVAHSYVENVYGLSSGFIHGGLPTDRVAVRWDLTSESVRERSVGDPPPSTPPPADASRLNPSELDGSGRRLPGQWDWGALGPDVAVEIPHDIQDLKLEERSIARQWRLHIREGLTTLFEKGFRIDGFHLLQEEDPRPFYRLSRRGSS